MRYNNAPIREAIFDIRVEGLKNSNLEQLENLFEVFKEIYPIKQKKINLAGKIEIVEDSVKTPFSSQLNGFVFKTQDEGRQVQVRLDGFTFNWVNNYSEWNEFSAEAFRLWSIYRNEFSNLKISRIALRYINRIKIPLPISEFQDYIVNMPPIPASLPQSYSNFFMRIEVPCDKGETSIVLSETIENPTKEYLPFILDIDVYKLGDLSSLDNNQLQSKFEELRNLKNITFENCITDKTRNLFN